MGKEAELLLGAGEEGWAALNCVGGVAQQSLSSPFKTPEVGSEVNWRSIERFE